MSVRLVVNYLLRIVSRILLTAKERVILQRGDSLLYCCFLRKWCLNKKLRFLACDFFTCGKLSYVF